MNSSGHASFLMGLQVGSKITSGQGLAICHAAENILLMRNRIRAMIIALEYVSKDDSVDAVTKHICKGLIKNETPSCDTVFAVCKSVDDNILQGYVDEAREHCAATARQVTLHEVMRNNPASVRENEAYGRENNVLRERIKAM